MQATHGGPFGFDFDLSLSVSSILSDVTACTVRTAQKLMAI
jgi:hypothetical protein